MITYLKAFLCLVALFFTTIARADVKLPQIISNHMVLQRNEPLRIWGWADAKEKVTVEFNNQKKSVRADSDGNWSVTLDPMTAGGPFIMTIKGDNEISLEDILIGEVWVCSGQSNMEWSVSQSNNPEEEIRNANYPNIRIFDVPRNLQLTPMDDIPETDWHRVSPETIAGFSAVGYFFGRHLHKNLDVPVGLIGSNWGGTVVETWTSKESINTIDDFNGKMDMLENLDPEELKTAMEEKLKEIKTSIPYKKDGLQDGVALWAANDFNDSEWNTMVLPALWENKYLPSLDGIVWFRKTFTLSKEEASSDATLKLSKIDDSDITWINGEKIGETENQYNRERVYNVPAKVLKEGKNIITVRVEDTGGGGGMWGSADNMSLSGKKIKISLAGDWKYQVSPQNLALGSSTIGPNDYPTLLYNGMIHPIEKFTVQGATWYQGESNASRADQYQKLFPLLITDWRENFNNPELTFLFVQLANFMEVKDKPEESAWAELREAQTMALELPKTGMAVIIDIGEADDIHPRNKQDVGYRLGLAARHVEYGEDIVYSGPMYTSMSVDGSIIRLTFDHTGSGLIADNKFGYLMGFQIAGSDKKWHWAKARIDGEHVIVYNEKVKNPVAVRYAWADNPEEANLYNREGLPASPFRTDNWKGITK